MTEKQAQSRDDDEESWFHYAAVLLVGTGLAALLAATLDGLFLLGKWATDSLTRPELVLFGLGVGCGLVGLGRLAFRVGELRTQQTEVEPDA